MKCKCGFVGDAEIGEFGVNGKFLYKEHYRCPQCKGLSDAFEYIESADCIRRELRFPTKCFKCSPEGVEKIVEFYIGGKIVGYCIYCPKCKDGMGSSITRETYDKLLEEFGALNTQMVMDVQFGGGRK